MYYFFGAHSVGRISQKPLVCRHPIIARWNPIWILCYNCQGFPLKVYRSSDIGCSLMQLRTMKFTLFLRELSAKISIASDRGNVKRSFISRFDAYSNGYETGEYEYRMARIDLDILQRSIDCIEKNEFSHVFLRWVSAFQKVCHSTFHGW